MPTLSADVEIAALVATLLRSGERLEELTGGEVDSVQAPDGRTFVLQGAQEHVRYAETSKQAAILNALPANIALVDGTGAIVSVNNAWRRFALDNQLQGPAFAIGVNYLDVCDHVVGTCAPQARHVAAGIRQVLSGALPTFSIDYRCDSPTDPRWCQLTVSPLGTTDLTGAVVMHLDVTANRRIEEDLRLSESKFQQMAQNIHDVFFLQSVDTWQIYYVSAAYEQLWGRSCASLYADPLSWMTAIHPEDHARIFREFALDRKHASDVACRIAVEVGEFRLSWIGIVDADSMQVVPVASAGADAGFLERVAERLSLLPDAPAGHGITVTAILEKREMVVNDVPNDPRIGFKGIHEARGIRSLVSLPMMIADGSVLVFDVHAEEINFFDAAELKLLRELAGNLAFAIDTIDQRQKLDYLAYYDALTGLANRKLFFERVAQSVRSAHSGKHKLVLYLVDLERFKYINDNMGQPTGDLLLQQVAQWLTRSVGDANLLTRMDADHFAVLLPQVKRDGDVARLLERTIEAFHAHEFVLGDTTVRLAVKIGIALYPDDGTDVETLFKHAEAALKKAKASGNRYLFYTQKMTEAMAGKVALETHLRQALEKGEFVLHYQPITNLRTGKVVGVEALLRWNDPRTQMVLPNDFIPMLEQTGLIHAVGRWVLQQAVDDHLRWRNAGYDPIRISVNVSAMQLRDPGFIDEITHAIAGDPVAAAWLELEITESMIMEDVEQNVAKLAALRALGVRTAIDDFGTGFSS
ncbi:MAG: EAL domain-containing protein, partial [Casimicrobiaceae bacterium]